MPVIVIEQSRQISFVRQDIWQYRDLPMQKALVLITAQAWIQRPTNIIHEERTLQYFQYYPGTGFHNYSILKNNYSKITIFIENNKYLLFNIHDYG